MVIAQLNERPISNTKKIVKLLLNNKRVNFLLLNPSKVSLGIEIVDLFINNRVKKSNWKFFSQV